jgi:hypothetical protein
MGFNDKEITHWSRGEYKGATNTVDDFDMITKYLPVIAEEHGETAADAMSIRSGVGRRLLAESSISMS